MQTSEELILLVVTEFAADCNSIEHELPSIGASPEANAFEGMSEAVASARTTIFEEAFNLSILITLAQPCLMCRINSYGPVSSPTTFHFISGIFTMVKRLVTFPVSG